MLMVKKLLSRYTTLKELLVSYVHRAWFSVLIGSALGRYIWVSNGRVSRLARILLVGRSLSYIQHGIARASQQAGPISFVDLNLPDIGGDALSAYPFSWTGLVSLYRLVFKTNFFFKWETAQKFYPGILDNLNAQLPFYLQQDLVRSECFFEEPVVISNLLLKQLDTLLLDAFNIYLFELIEKDPFVVFHFFYNANVQKLVIEDFLVTTVPYLLSRYYTFDYLTKLRHYVPQSAVSSVWTLICSDTSWSYLLYVLFYERGFSYVYFETLGGRFFGLGDNPFYTFWTHPTFQLDGGAVLCMLLSCLGAGWYFFYSRLDYLAFKAEPYRSVIGGQSSKSSNSESVLSRGFWFHHFNRLSLKALMRWANVKFPDNFIVFFHAGRLRFRQEFIAKTPWVGLTFRDLDFLLFVIFCLFFARGRDYLRLYYKRRDFLRVIRRLRRRINRRYEFSYRRAVSPVVSLAGVADNKIRRQKFVPLRKRNDFPLVWRSRLARFYWVPYRSRKRLTTMRPLELLLTRHLGRMARRRFRKRPWLSRFYRELRWRSMPGMTDHYAIRSSLVNRREVALQSRSYLSPSGDEDLESRPRLYGGYLRAGTDQRFDVFAVVDPSDTLLTLHQYQLDDSLNSLTFFYQQRFGMYQSIDCWEMLLRDIGSSGLAALGTDITLFFRGREHLSLANFSGIIGWGAYTEPVFNGFLRQREVDSLSLLDFSVISDLNLTPALIRDVPGWVNFYFRQRHVDRDTHNILYQQRWFLANELLNNLFLDTLTQDRSRQLMPRLAWSTTRFSRYFVFYNKQLRYNLAFSEVGFPPLLAFRLQQTVNRRASVGQPPDPIFQSQTTEDPFSFEQILLNSLDYSTGVRGGHAVPKNQTALVTSYITTGMLGFRRFISLGFSRKQKPKRFRFFHNYDSEASTRPLRQANYIDKQLRFSAKNGQVYTRSWRRLLRHKQIWRITSALRAKRLYFAPDEIQRQRQQGAMYGFLVPTPGKRSVPATRSRLRQSRRVEQLLAERNHQHTTLYVRRSQEQKLFRLLHIRKIRRWRRLFRKYAAFRLPIRKKDRQLMYHNMLRTRKARQFFLPYETDRQKGIFRHIRYIPQKIIRLLRRHGFGALARLSLRNEKKPDRIFLFLGKRYRPRLRRWKFRKNRARGSLVTMPRTTLRQLVTKLPKSRVAKQLQYARTAAKDAARSRPTRANWSVRRRQLNVGRLNSFYKRVPSTVENKKFSPFYLKLVRRFKWPIRTRGEQRIEKPEDFSLTLLKEHQVAATLRNASFFRSPLMPAWILTDVRNRALTHFSKRHRFQYLLLRRKMQLLQSLPFFKTNRHQLRYWLRFSEPFLKKQHIVQRTLVADLHQKLYLKRVVPSSYIQKLALLDRFRFLRAWPAYLNRLFWEHTQDAFVFSTVARNAQTSRSLKKDQRRIVRYYGSRFLAPLTFLTNKEKGFFLKSRKFFEPLWGSLYYSFGNSRGSQHFKLFAPLIAGTSNIPLLWNELVLNQRFLLRNYFEESVRVIGERVKTRSLDTPLSVTDFSFQPPKKEFLFSKTLVKRALILLERSRDAAVSPRFSGFSGQYYDDRLWHIFPYRLHKDRMRFFRRRMAKARYLVLEYIRKDWYELFNDYCQDWELFQNVQLGRRSDIIDAEFLVRTRGFDPHFKLIKRAEMSDIAVLAETFSHQFRVASLFPQIIKPWRGFFRVRKYLKLVMRVAPTANHRLRLRRYRQSGFYRVRRLFRSVSSLAGFRHLFTLLNVSQDLRVPPSFVSGRGKAKTLLFRKTQRPTRKFLVFRGPQAAYHSRLQLWKIRRRRNVRVLQHLRSARTRRRWGLFQKAFFMHERGRLGRRWLQKIHFKLRHSPAIYDKRFRKTRRVLRSSTRRTFVHYPLKRPGRQRYFNYFSTRQRAPVLFRSSSFSKTRYFLHVQQDLLTPRILRYIRPAKLSRLHVPSTFLAKAFSRPNRFYRKRFMRRTLFKPTFRKTENRFRRVRSNHRMRWLRNRAVRHLRRSYLTTQYDNMRSIPLWLRTSRFRPLPYQFKIVPVEQLPQMARRSIVLSVHNFSEYMTPKWKDLLGILDSFNYFDYRYRNKVDRSKTGEEAPAVLRRNRFGVDEDLLTATGTTALEFETRVFSHHLRRSQEWDLLPFTIDPQLQKRRVRFTWLHRVLARHLGTRLYRRYQSWRRAEWNRLSWLLFYEQFLSNAVVKQQFGRYLRWHRLARQLHITWRFASKRPARRAIRYKRHRHFLFFRSFHLFRLRFRNGRKRPDLTRNYLRHHRGRYRWLLYKRIWRGYPLRPTSVSLFRSLVPAKSFGPVIKIPKQRYGFWALTRRVQNRLRLGDAISFINFRFFHDQHASHAASLFSLRYQLAINLFEYRKFHNRLSGKLRKRPRSVFFGRDGWKTRKIWFNPDRLLFDRPIARGQRVGRAWRKIGGRRKVRRRHRRPLHFFQFFRRASWVLGLVRGQREVRQSYLHRFSTRYSLHTYFRTSFPYKQRRFKKPIVFIPQLYERRFGTAQLHSTTVSDLLQQQRLQPSTTLDIGIEKPFFILKYHYNRERARRLYNKTPKFIRHRFKFHRTRVRRLVRRYTRPQIMLLMFRGRRHAFSWRQKTTRWLLRGGSPFKSTIGRQTHVGTVSPLLASMVWAPYLLSSAKGRAWKRRYWRKDYRSTWRRRADHLHKHKYKGDIIRRVSFFRWLLRRRRTAAFHRRLVKRALVYLKLQSHFKKTQRVFSKRTSRRRFFYYKQRRWWWLRRRQLDHQERNLLHELKPNNVIINALPASLKRRFMRQRLQRLFYRQRLNSYLYGTRQWQFKPFVFVGDLRREYYDYIDYLPRPLAAFKRYRRFRRFWQGKRAIRWARVRRDLLQSRKYLRGVVNRRLLSSINRKNLMLKRQGSFWYGTRSRNQRFARFAMKKFLPVFWPKLRDRIRQSLVFSRRRHFPCKPRANKLLFDLKVQRIRAKQLALRLTTIGHLFRKRRHAVAVEAARTRLLVAQFQKRAAQARIRARTGRWIFLVTAIKQRRRRRYQRYQRFGKALRKKRILSSVSSHSKKAARGGHRFLLTSQVTFDKHGFPMRKKVPSPTKPKSRFFRLKRPRALRRRGTIWKARSRVIARQPVIPPRILRADVRFLRAGRRLKLRKLSTELHFISRLPDYHIRRLPKSRALLTPTVYASYFNRRRSRGNNRRRFNRLRRSNYLFRPIALASRYQRQSQYVARKRLSRQSDSYLRRKLGYYPMGLESIMRGRHLGRKRTFLFKFRNRGFPRPDFEYRLLTILVGTSNYFSRMFADHKRYESRVWFNPFSKRRPGTRKFPARAMRRLYWSTASRAGLHHKSQQRVPRGALLLRNAQGISLHDSKARHERRLRRRTKGYRSLNAVRKTRYAFWVARRRAVRKRLWRAYYKHAQRGRLRIYRDHYRRFKKRLGFRLWVRVFRKRHRKRFLLFRRPTKRAGFAQTRYKFRNFDWITRRIRPQYLRDVVYTRSLTNIMFPRPYHHRASKSNSFSPAVVAQCLNSLSVPELSINYQLASQAKAQSGIIDIYSARQQRLLALTHSVDAVPFGWTYSLREGDALLHTGGKASKWQTFTDLFGGVSGRSSQIVLWLLSGYATSKALLSKELFVAQFLTQTLGLLTGTPVFDFSYVITYWAMAWWESFQSILTTNKEPLVFSMDAGLEEPYLLQQIIHRYEYESDRERWLCKLSNGLETMTGVTISPQGYFILSPRATLPDMAIRQLYLQKVYKPRGPSGGSQVVLLDLLADVAHTARVVPRPTSQTLLYSRVRRHKFATPRPKSVYMQILMANGGLPRFFRVRNRLWKHGLVFRYAHFTKIMRTCTTALNHQIKKVPHGVVISPHADAYFSLYPGPRLKESFAVTQYDKRPRMRARLRLTKKQVEYWGAINPIVFYRLQKGLMENPYYRRVEPTQLLKIGGHTFPENLADPVESRPYVIPSGIVEDVEAELFSVTPSLSGSGHSTPLQQIVVKGHVLPTKIVNSTYEEIMDGFDPLADDAFFRIASALKTFQTQELDPISDLDSPSTPKEENWTTKYGVSVDSPASPARSISSASTTLTEFFCEKLLTQEDKLASFSYDDAAVFGIESDDEIISYEPPKKTVRDLIRRKFGSNPRYTIRKNMRKYYSKLFRIPVKPRIADSPHQDAAVTASAPAANQWDMFSRELSELALPPAPPTKVPASIAPVNPLAPADLKRLPFLFVGDLTFFETNGMNIFQIHNVVSEAENVLRVDAGLEPTLTHEQLRAMALDQNTESARMHVLENRMRRNFEVDFLLFDVDPDYLPAPIATEDELALYMSHFSEPEFRRLRPFMTQIEAALREQLLLTKPGVFTDIDIQNFLRRTSEGLRYNFITVPVYASGMGTQGVWIKVKLSPQEEARARQNLFSECFRPLSAYTSLATWEYTEYLFTFGDIGNWLPDWALTPSGRPPEWLQEDCRRYGLGAFGRLAAVREFVALDLPPLIPNNEVRCVHDLRYLMSQDAISMVLSPRLVAAETRPKVTLMKPKLLELPTQRRQRFNSTVIRLLNQRPQNPRERNVPVGAPSLFSTTGYRVAPPGPQQPPGIDQMLTAHARTYFLTTEQREHIQAEERERLRAEQREHIQAEERAYLLRRAQYIQDQAEEAERQAQNLQARAEEKSPTIPPQSTPTSVLPIIAPLPRFFTDPIEPPRPYVQSELERQEFEDDTARADAALERELEEYMSKVVYFFHPDTLDSDGEPYDEKKDM